MRAVVQRVTSANVSGSCLIVHERRVHVAKLKIHLILSCLVLQNNQQTSSWSITLVVGHGMRTGAHLAS